MGKDDEVEGYGPKMEGKLEEWRYRRLDSQRSGEGEWEGGTELDVREKGNLCSLNSTCLHVYSL